MNLSESNEKRSEPRRKVAGGKHAPRYHEMFEIRDVDLDELYDLYLCLQQGHGVTVQAAKSLFAAGDEIIWSYTSSLIAFVSGPTDREIARIMKVISETPNLSPRALQMMYLPISKESLPPLGADNFEIAIWMIDDHFAATPSIREVAKDSWAEAITLCAQVLAEKHGKLASVYRANKTRDDETIHAISKMIPILEGCNIPTSLPGNSFLSQITDRALFKSAQWLLQVTRSRLVKIEGDPGRVGDLVGQVWQHQNIGPETFSRDLRRAKRLAKAVYA